MHNEIRWTKYHYTMSPYPLLVPRTMLDLRNKRRDENKSRGSDLRFEDPHSGTDWRSDDRCQVMNRVSFTYDSLSRYLLWVLFQQTSFRHLRFPTSFKPERISSPRPQCLSPRQYTFTRLYSYFFSTPLHLWVTSLLVYSGLKGTLLNSEKDLPTVFRSNSLETFGSPFVT